MYRVGLIALIRGLVAQDTQPARWKTCVLPYTGAGVAATGRWGSLLGGPDLAVTGPTAASYSWGFAYTLLQITPKDRLSAVTGQSLGIGWFGCEANNYVRQF